MSQQRSIGINLFAILEIIVGAIGSAFLVKSLMAYLSVLIQSSGSTGLQGALNLINIFLYLPFPLIFTAGISIFISLALGKTVNDKALSLMYFVVVVFVGFHVYTAQYTLIIWDIIIFFIATLPLQWFLNHKIIKNLMVKQY